MNRTGRTQGNNLKIHGYCQSLQGRNLVLSPGGSGNTEAL
jgi:hypothetical protein